MKSGFLVVLRYLGEKIASHGEGLEAVWNILLK